VGFVGDQNAYYEGDPVVLAPPAARTTSASGNPQATGHFVGLDRFVRVSWTITGTTPSFTFAVSGELVG
jgi:hypothetical protein